MTRTLDLSQWNRRAHFELFRSYDLPFFNVTAEVDVTELRRRCSLADGPSFFASSLFLAMGAVNEIEELRYRIRGDKVVVIDRLDAGSTVLLDDETFTFAYFDYLPDYPRFAAGVSRTLEEVRSGSRKLEPADHRDDLIHFSVLPWISFTSVSHARRLNSNDSVPKVMFGKHFESADRRRMPVSIEAHHGLVDGLHIGRFFERFQELLDLLPLGS